MIRKLLAWCKQRYNKWQFNRKFNLSERGKLKAITARAFIEQLEKEKIKAARRAGITKARNQARVGFTLKDQMNYSFHRLKEDLFYPNKDTLKAEKILKAMATEERDYKW